MKTPRQRVHDAFEAGGRPPECVWMHRGKRADDPAIIHEKPCDEMTAAVAFDRLLLKNGHCEAADDVAQAAPEACP